MSQSRCTLAIRLLRVAMIAGAACLLFLPLPERWSTGWRSALLDLGHVPLFAMLVVVLAFPNRSAWRAATIAAGFAGGAELVQGLIGRTADWGDFLRGVLGAAAAATAIRAWRSRGNRSRATLLLLAAAGLLTWPIVEAEPRLHDAYDAHRNFPELATFDTPRERLRWNQTQAEFARIPDPLVPGAWVGRLDFHPGPAPYPSAELEPIIGDFRGYRWLCCSFEVEGGPLGLAISIRGGPIVNRGTTHAQVSRAYAPGLQQVRLDLPQLAATAEERPLDLADVRLVQFFAVRPASVRTVVVRRIWLEP